MKKVIAVAVLGGLMALGSARVQAQGTNVVLNVNFALTAQVQETDTLVKNRSINSKAIIQAIGEDLGLTNGFSRNAKLVVVIPPPDALVIATFGIKDGGEFTDISNFLTVTQVGTSVATTRARVTSDWSIQNFRLLTSTLAFDVQGFTKIISNNFVSRGVDFGDTPASVNASVSGLGTVGGLDAVMKGSVNAGGRRVDDSF